MNTLRACLGLLLLAACPEQDAPEPRPTAHIVAPPTLCDADPLPRAGEAIAGWIKQRSRVDDVPLGAPDCDVYALAWRDFLALMAPGAHGVAEYRSWVNAEDLFDLGGEGPSAAARAQAPVATRAVAKGGVAYADEFVQAAAMVPLLDQAGRMVHYTVLLNQAEAGFVDGCALNDQTCFNHTGPPGAQASTAPSPWRFPTAATADAQATELKLAWRVLEICPEGQAGCKREAHPDFITAPGRVPHPSPGPAWDTTVDATLGLVGMHIVRKTPNHPGWIWASFEHKRNAPTCAAADALAAAGTEWSFFDPECAGPGCMQNAFCLAQPVDHVREPGWSLVKSTAAQQIADGVALAKDGKLWCTQAPGALFYAPDIEGVYQKTQPALFDPDHAGYRPTQVCRKTLHNADGTVAPAIPLDAARLNRLVAAAAGQLGGDAGVMAHYELVGALWYADNQGPALGSPQLSNMSMETFEQNLGCQVCHADQFNSNPYPKLPARGLADRSFVFQRLSQGGVADCGSVPASCPAPTGGK